MKTRILPVIVALVGCYGSDRSERLEPLQRTSLELEEGDVLVIRQVYGGGGNNGATLRRDFIELFNAGSASLSLAGLSLQYASSKGSFGVGDANLTLLPNTPLAAGQSFLVEGAQGSGGSQDLPTPDLVDVTPLALSGTAGRVALVNGTTSLDCGDPEKPCDAAAMARILDLLGYGAGTTSSEGSPTKGLSNTTAALRKRGGCQDTNDNTADFDLLAPAPRNAGSALAPCGDPVKPEPEPDAGTPVTENHGEPGSTRIHDIQGATHLSPLAGTSVSKVEGIVTALGERGFWLQDPTPDENPATSEGIFVFTSSAPAVQVADRVYVSGSVVEFRPGCSNCSETSSGFDNLTTTQLTTNSKILVVATGEALPAATLVGPTGRMPPLARVAAPGAEGNVETQGAVLDVANDGLAFHESLEGMRVSLVRPVASGPTIDFKTTQEVAVSLPDARSRLSARGGLLLGERGHGDDSQPERFHVSSLLSGHDTFPKLNTGDSFDGSVFGVVDYSFGKFLLLATELPRVVPGGIERETATLPATSARALDVATFNLENLGGDDLQARFDGMGKAIVERLGSPDLLVLEEVQDENGAAKDGLTRSDLTISRLTMAVSAAGGPGYEYRDIAPVDGKDGGEPGGNIRVGIMFRSDRGLAFIDRPGGGNGVATSVIARNGAPQLSTSPGLISPSDPAFDDSRKPLVAELTFAGQPLFVVGSHWNSKGGDDPTFGRFQPPQRSSEIQRRSQAALVTDFVKQILAIDAQANVIVLGDLNDYRYSESISTLVDGAKLVHLIDSLPESERYGYVFQGVSQMLDHVISSQAMAKRLVGFDVVHINAEFASHLSDHDPSVARFAFAADGGDDGMTPGDGGDTGMPATSGGDGGTGLTPDEDEDGGDFEIDTDPISGSDGGGTSSSGGCGVSRGTSPPGRLLLVSLWTVALLASRRRPKARRALSCRRC